LKRNDTCSAVTAANSLDCVRILYPNQKTIKINDMEYIALRIIPYQPKIFNPKTH